MAYSKLATVLVTTAGVLVFNVSAIASQHQCTAGKLGATGKKAYKKASCHASAAGKGEAVDVDCLTKAEITFSAKFAIAEANPPCFVTGDEVSIEGKVDTFISDLETALRPVMTESSCASRKIRAAGKKAFKVLNCHRKAVNKGEVVDPSCVSDEDAAMILAFAAADGMGDCLTMGDIGTIEGIVDAFVDDIVTDVRPITPTNCTPRKLNETADKAGEKLHCYERAVHFNAVVEAGCLSDAEAKFSAGFASAEAQADCLAPTGDAAAIEAKVDAFIDDVATDLIPSLPVASGPSKCTERKLSNAGRKAEKKLRCYSVAYQQGLPLDAECLTNAEVNFSVGFATAEGAGDCLAPTGDDPAIEAKVDAFVDDIVTDLVP
jgi:hypothetical protein